MEENKRSVFEEDTPPLEFLRYIVKLADRATDLNADRIIFDLGPFDGVSLNVEIRFSFKGLKED